MIRSKKRYILKCDNNIVALFELVIGAAGCLFFSSVQDGPIGFDNSYFSTDGKFVLVLTLTYLGFAMCFAVLLLNIVLLISNIVKSIHPLINSVKSSRRAIVSNSE